MTNHSVGHEAEKRAAEFLKTKGYKIIDTNWQTRFCEIDIVSAKHNLILFVEVKYRTSGAQGSGLEYITPKKVKQMQFAAEMWVQQNRWYGEYEIGAIELTKNFVVTNFLQSIL